ncbi:MAG: TetR/AcrR family transcriptional regulator [Pseudomonadales bacterium]|nr:TetR/AcrR family transcriptional regulator [Pseudomonadales bacterium]
MKSIRSKGETNIDARVLRSKKLLIQAGRRLLNKSYETSMSEIASHAGVGRATLYRLFETKDDLLVAIAKDCLETFEHATNHIETEATSALDAIRMFYSAIVPLAEEMQFIINLAYFAPEDPELMKLYEKQQEDMRVLVELAKEEGSIVKDLDTDWIINVLDALLYPTWKMRQQNAYSDEDLSELAFKTLCHGIKG